MAKEILGLIKLQIPAGGANPSPPVGPALGQRGLNIMDFCKAFNDKTKDLEKGAPIPVIITAYKDRSFDFTTKLPPVSFYLKKAAKIKKGNSTPGRSIVGKVSMQDIEKIAKEKMQDLNAINLKGAMNMVNVAIAIATAGIIVGAVSSTGLSNAMIEVVEIISGGNIVILLFMVMVLCLILGLGLPTTANYLVVAALMANVIVEIGGASGIILPLIAVHLYVFYFGLMADVTPPVGLAAYAASAISRADPIRTGVQAFYYEIRTAILPIVFIFNPELLLIGVESFWHGALIFIVSLIAIFAFTSAAQGWFITKLRWYEIIMLLIITISMFRPDFIMNRIYPEYQNFEKNFNEVVEFKEKRKLRLHVTRYTDYGERYKMFAFPIEPSSTSLTEVTGLEIDKNLNNNFEVVNLTFMGPGEEIGMDFYDEITKIEISSLSRPPKEYIYIFGLLLLVLTYASQKNKIKKNKKI